MHKILSLNGAWQLLDEILTYSLANARKLSHLEDGWMAQPVPGDIHQGLMNAGRIAEPLLGLNSFDSTWTETRSWWFRRTFVVPDGWQDADVVELEMHGLDCNAEIFLNGAHIGSHPSAFRPFVRDVKTGLRDGENVLLVRLTAGVEHVTEADVDSCDGVRPGTEAGNGRPERGEPRRTFARKPQYSWGWDWSPRTPTTAIGGDITLRLLTTACIRDVVLRPVRHGDEVLVYATVTVDQFHYYKTKEGTIKVIFTDVQGRQFRAETKALLRSGLTYVELRLSIPDTQLWWPNGLGDQHLYKVEAILLMDDHPIDDDQTSDYGTIDYQTFNYGIRFIELDTDDTFAFVVNGKKIYAKGANWIPADALYARVSDEKYDTLIREAHDANFNMLRIWGGGLYERDAFYDACDRYGILLWHDFMFACAPYPDHLAWFREEVEKEADYQTRRLRRHASLALWCGNNENHWGFRDWWKEKTRGGARVYNYILPAVVQRNCPEIPYWNSSPYGGEKPNAYDVGDCHYWGEGTMNPDMQVRITPETYDACTARFVSEFGYIGAPGKDTVLTYLDGAPFDRQGKVWQHHNNTFEKNTVDAGIRKHYADPDTLSPDDYLLYSGLVQGMMYTYALDAMHANPKCGGNLFWMYEDCWGEVGWTIVDYDLRRKPAWYFVRRTYAPLRLILRPAGDEAIRVIIANDGFETAAFDLEYGYLSLGGSLSKLRTVRVQAASSARTEALVFPRGDLDPTCGLWIARVPEWPDIAPAIFRAVDYRKLRVGHCKLQITHHASRITNGAWQNVVQISADSYAHAVHFTLPEGALPSDNYFDLLPGETREVVITAAAPLDPTAIGVTCVNA
ncbi:MAG: beta-mannosidase [Anaerolineae bacterium]|nr:beta-mannosidase [Anaerolineae bacterium]